MNITTSFRTGLIVLATALLAFGLFTANAFYNNKYTTPGPKGYSGMVNLNGDDLANNQPLFLTQGWEFYQHLLLTPESITQSRPIPNAQITIGAKQGFELGGDNPRGNATYRLVLNLDSSAAKMPLTLEIPEIYGDYTLYINGVPVQSSQSKLSNVTILRLPQNIPQIELLLAVSDSTHFYSGLIYPPALGSEQSLTLLFLKRLAFTIFTFCLALLAGLFYLAIGIKAKGKTTAFLFSLLCFAAIGASSYPLIHLLTPFGEGFYLPERFCYYLQFLLMMLIGASFCGASFKWRLPPLVIGSFICILTMLYSFLSFLHSLNSILAFSRLIDLYKWGVVVYLAFLFFYHHKILKQDAILLGCGTAVFGVGLICDRLYPLYEPIIGGYMAETAVLIYMALLAVLLTKQSIAAYLENYSLKAQNRFTALQLDLEQRRYADLTQNLETTAHFRHDLRQHYRLMQRCLDMGDIKGLSDYLKNYREALPQSLDAPVCEHATANLILSYYMALAAKKDIPTTFHVKIPQDIPFIETDLCVLLGNALENALEASEDVANPLLDLSVTFQNSNFLIISLHNRCCLKAIPTPGSTTKGLTHSGSGLVSMAAIAKKYKGTLEYNLKDNIFQLSIILQGNNNFKHFKIP